MQSAENGIIVQDHYRREEIRAYDVNLCTVQALNAQKVEINKKIISWVAETASELTPDLRLPGAATQAPPLGSEVELTRPDHILLTLPILGLLIALARTSD